MIVSVGEGMGQFVQCRAGRSIQQAGGWFSAKSGQGDFVKEYGTIALGYVSSRNVNNRRLGYVQDICGGHFSISNYPI